MKKSFAVICIHRAHYSPIGIAWKGSSGKNTRSSSVKQNLDVLLSYR
jgi:hypothetical protein